MIPIIVGPLYFGMGYPSWVIAAFAMVQWEVVMDPPNATLWRAWVWHRGGSYFGVPLSNFLSWFVTAWIYFQLFALAVVKRRPRPTTRPRAFWLVPIVLYLASGLCHVPSWFMDCDAQVTDAGVRLWSAGDLRETTVIVMLFTMLPTFILAVLRL